MSFEGPDPRDYANVVALNAAYLRCLRRHRGEGAGACASPLLGRLTGLTVSEMSRLAEAPFLLFSLREQDDRYWDRLLDGADGGDLFRAAPSPELAILRSAALGFAWHLAGRNPYSLRLFCGATLYWCERIADLTLYRLLDVVRDSAGVPVLRMAEHHALWRKLLDDGTSPASRIRHAAQFAALQTVLTAAASGRRPETLPLAAKRSRAPGLRVADD